MNDKNSKTAKVKDAHPENYYKIKEMLRKLADRCETLAENLTDRDGQPLHPEDIELIRIVLHGRFKRIAREAGLFFLAGEDLDAERSMTELHRVISQIKHYG